MTWNHVPAVGLVGLALLGCSREPEVPKPSAPPARSVGELVMGRDTLIQVNIDRWGKESFPDNPDVVWRAGKIVHQGEYSLVESEPMPPTVGYPRFRFILHFPKGADPAVAGCHAWDQGRWMMLFTRDEVPPEWRNP
jgi:hypothetical protein